MKFKSDKKDQIVWGIGTFKDGILEVTDENHIEKLKKHGYKTIKNVDIVEDVKEIVDEDWTVDELRKLASEREIPSYTKLKKDELIKILNADE